MVRRCVLGAASPRGELFNVLSPARMACPKIRIFEQSLCGPELGHPRRVVVQPRRRGKMVPPKRRSMHRKSNSHPTATTKRRAAHPRVSDRAGSRGPDRGGRQEPPRSPGCDHDPGRLPARSPGIRADRPALGADRLSQSRPARPSDQGRHSGDAPDPGRRAARPTQAPNASRRRPPRSCSPLRARDRSAPPVLPACSSAQASPPGWHSRPIPTCCGMPAASRWRTRGRIPGRCRPTWVTRISNTPCATPSCRRLGLRTFGDERLPGVWGLCGLRLRLRRRAGHPPGRFARWARLPPAFLGCSKRRGRDSERRLERG